MVICSVPNLNTPKPYYFGWTSHTLHKSPNEVANSTLVYNPQASRRKRGAETHRDALLFLKSTV